MLFIDNVDKVDDIDEVVDDDQAGVGDDDALV